MKKEITGIILAGGKSSRMGYINKGLTAINNRKCIEYVVQALTAVVDDMIIIANTDAYDYLELAVYEDIIKDLGPIGGIYTGLSVSETQKNLIVACDMPFITTNLLKHILFDAEPYEIVVPLFKEQMHPLCGYYAKDCTSKIKELIQDEILKMQKVINLFNCKILPITQQLEFYKENLFYNINTLKELSAIQNISKDDN